MKKIFAMALVALTVLTSCAKQDEDVLNSNGTKTLKLSINAGQFTRAAEQPLANHEKTTITSLYVYFVDNVDPEAGGAVVLGSTTLSETEITAATSISGHEITGVSSSAKSVYIVANYSENGVTLADPAGTTIQSIQEKTATMAAVSTNNTTDWIKALLSNAPRTYVPDNGLIGPVDGSNKASVKVSIMPSLSRIEVVSLNANQTAGVSNEVKVSKFDLKGVYLNRYYPEFSVKGDKKGTAQSISTDPAVAITTVPAWFKDEYSETKGQTSYTAADFSSKPNDIWAYMLPAATPRIIFHLDNIEYGTPTVSLGKEQYLTVKRLTYAEATTVGGITHAAGSDVEFTRGCIYKVNSVVFDLSKLHDNPNADNIDVTVTVTVLGWQGIVVNPEF